MELVATHPQATRPTRKHGASECMVCFVLGDYQSQNYASSNVCSDAALVDGRYKVCVFRKWALIDVRGRQDGYGPQRRQQQKKKDDLCCIQPKGTRRHGRAVTLGLTRSDETSGGIYGSPAPASVDRVVFPAGP